MLKFILSLGLVAAFVWGCGPLLQSCWGIKDAEGKIDWPRVKKYAKLSDLAYKSEKDVKSEKISGFGEELYTKILDGVESRVILITDHKNKLHWVAIEGTANKTNVKLDAEYLKEKDPTLGIWVHKGFHKLATAVYNDLKPKLVPGYKIRVTGHSLGGAAAAVLSMMYSVEGTLEECVTFGQPKVTNEKGVKKYWDLPIIRIVDNKDIVPLVPPLTIISAIHGTYRHVGVEVILKPSGRWLWLSKHNANRMLVTGTWSNLFNESIDDHYMRNYIEKIEKILKKE
ncbi:MAG: lipase family protein [Candidatus Peribacter sp.]|nr:lipase family protein [Candidatus Peribacter sp.]